MNVQSQHTPFGSSRSLCKVDCNYISSTLQNCSDKFCSQATCGSSDWNKDQTALQRPYIDSTYRQCYVYQGETSRVLEYEALPEDPSLRETEDQLPDSWRLEGWDALKEWFSYGQISLMRELTV